MVYSMIPVRGPDFAGAGVTTGRTFELIFGLTGRTPWRASSPSLIMPDERKVADRLHTADGNTVCNLRT